MRFKLVVLVAAVAMLATTGFAEAQVFGNRCCPQPAPSCCPAPVRVAQPCCQPQPRQVISRRMIVTRVVRTQPSCCGGTVVGSAPVMSSVPVMGSAPVMSSVPMTSGCCGATSGAIVSSGVVHGQGPTPILIEEEEDDEQDCEDDWFECRNHCMGCTGADLTACHAHCDCMKTVCEGTNTEGCDPAPIGCYGQVIGGK